MNPVSGSLFFGTLRLVHPDGGAAPAVVTAIKLAKTALVGMASPLFLLPVIYGTQSKILILRSSTSTANERPSGENARTEVPVLALSLIMRSTGPGRSGSQRCNLLCSDMNATKFRPPDIA
jgi:hypothetical protein